MTDHEKEEFHKWMERALEGDTKIIVQTDESEPETIAIITANDVQLAAGYRLQFLPVLEVKSQLQE